MLVKGPVWGQKSTKWTPRVVANKVSSSLEVGLLRARAQPKVDEEGFSESCRVCAVKVPANLTIFPKITQTVNKLPNSPTYHLMVPKVTELYRISPDYTR